MMVPNRETGTLAPVSADEPPLTSTSALMETQQRPVCPPKRICNVDLLYQDIPGDSRTNAVLA